MDFCRYPGPDPAPLPKEPKLKTPAQQRDLQKFQTEFQLQMGCQIAEVDTALGTCLSIASRCTDSEEHSACPKAPLSVAGLNAQLMESLNADLQWILQEARPIAMQTMPHTQGGEPMHRYKTRVPNRTLTKHCKMWKALPRGLKPNNASEAAATPCHVPSRHA